MLFGGLKFQEIIYNSTASAALSVIASVAVTTLVIPFTVEKALESAAWPTQKIDHTILLFSTVMASLYFVIYAVSVLFTTMTNGYLFEETPAHIVEMESVPGPIHALFAQSQSKISDDAQDRPPRAVAEDLTEEIMIFSWATQLAYLVIGGAGVAGLVFTAHYVMSQVEPLAQVSPSTTNFLSLIIVPLSINSSNYIKITSSVLRRPELSTIVSIAFRAAIGNVLITLSLLILVGWNHNGYSKKIAVFPVSNLAVLLGSVWMMALITLSGRATYLHGTMCIATQVDFDARGTLENERADMNNRYIIIATWYFLDLS